MLELAALTHSDSDSDCDIPKFEISAFKKFDSSNPEHKSSSNFHNKSIQLSSSLHAGEEYNKTSYVNLYPERESIQDQIQRHKELMKKSLDENAEKSIVLQPGFQKLETVPVFQLKHKRRKEGIKERDKTSGTSWYNMPAPEMTDEKKNDLLVIQMRQALDPKQFYKRSAVKGNPKYFQVGTFVESPVEFYSSRIPKKQRKQTLVEELLADAQFRQYQKKKFGEIQRNQPAKFVKRKKEKKLKPADFRENNAHKNVAKGKKKKSKKVK